MSVLGVMLQRAGPAAAAAAMKAATVTRRATLRPTSNQRRLSLRGRGNPTTLFQRRRHFLLQSQP